MKVISHAGRRLHPSAALVPALVVSKLKQAMVPGSAGGFHCGAPATKMFRWESRGDRGSAGREGAKALRTWPNVTDAHYMGTTLFCT